MRSFSYLPNDSLQCKCWVQYCEYSASTHQNACLHCPQLWMQRADFQTKTVCKQSSGAEGITVLRAEAQLLPQLDTLDITRSQEGERYGAIPALALNLPCFLPVGCNLHPSHTFPLPTSHQSWHLMQTAFRNRVWDTRDAAHVWFIIVIPVCRKAYVDAVHRF